MDSTQTRSADAFDVREFRGALGAFATGVTIMTTQTPDGQRLGATVSSFNSVSLEPPLILFSLARSAQAFAGWETAQGFAVNILAEGQTDLSNRFAKPLSDKWSDLPVSSGPLLGLPLLPQVLATMECSIYARYDGGDHLIMVGRVVSFLHNTHAKRPLLFYGSRYRSLDTKDAIATPHDADIWLHGW